MCVKGWSGGLVDVDIRDFARLGTAVAKITKNPTGTSRVTIKPVATPGAGTGEGAYSCCSIL